MVLNTIAAQDRLNFANQHSNSSAKAMHPNIQSLESNPKVLNEDDVPLSEENTARDVNHFYPNIKKGPSKFAQVGNDENCSLF